MGDPKRRQITFNAESQGQWDAFAGHRQKVSDLLLGALDGGRRLCVLGAGNGNDLDLPALLEATRELHLVDLDAEALARGVRRQGVGGHPALRLAGGLDVTGTLGRIATWSPRTSLSDEDIAAIAESPALRVVPALPGPFDVVASTCLLRPLIAEAFHAVGPHHPRFTELVRAIRVGHLRLLTRLVAPGGRAVLITDVVSSATLPELGALPDSALPGLLPRLVRERNFFHGVSPTTLASSVRRDPVLQARVIGQEPVPPWRWRLHSKLYLVWAMVYRAGPITETGERRSLRASDSNVRRSNPPGSGDGRRQVPPS
jgi:hypothetical protein